MSVNNAQSPEQARQDLVATLNAIEDKLNVPKRVSHAADRGKIRARRLRAKNPAGFYAGAVAVAGAAGLVAWGLVRALSR
ncbi:hypothetical protein [Mycetocola spongiae]|uniref:hypothetical protein n=1 Tax=Mycetocola spongiae TaxID=2859226 RepID=UPI001CF0F39E|nr:hypothetical protein [Mycetocola spongiae]UCR88179.1 DUF3618 domain-containing protein [Mycetocola spongiae]